MGISTFGSFTQARLGIYASQAGLSITGNNISNINTPGYTRQKLVQTSFYSGGSDRYYSSTSLAIGNGVLCRGTSQMRDPYLDLRFRNENASVGFMDAKLNGLEHIQRILDETGKGEEGFGVLGAQLNDFYKQLQNLNNHTGLDEYDIQVRSSAESLCKMFNTYAAQLKEAQQNSEKNFELDVKKVNNILESIRDLNSTIRKAEIHGDPGLELKDERNLLIDQLSQYIKIDVPPAQEDIGSSKIDKLVIRMIGQDGNIITDKDGKPVDLVNGIYSVELSVPKSLPNPLDPDGDPVANSMLQIQLSVPKDAKGNPDPNNPKESVLLGDTDMYGALQAQREFLTEAGEFCTQEALDMDDKASVKRGIPFYQKALDLLAKQFADTFNKANQGYVRNEHGQYVSEDGTVVTDADDKPITDASFEGKTLEEIAELNQILADKKAYYIGKPLFSSQGNQDNEQGITAENISISRSWTTGAQIVNSFVRHSITGIGSTDSSNISHMLILMQTKTELKPGPDAASQEAPIKGTFNEMWDNLGNILGNDMMTTDTMLNTYQTSSNNLDIGRDSVSSVDLNDEAASLMQYSKSYNAACRLMTTLDTVLEKLIDGTGVTR